VLQLELLPHTWELGLQLALALAQELIRQNLLHMHLA
jgi:hypothetical protein